MTDEQLATCESPSLPWRQGMPSASEVDMWAVPYRKRAGRLAQVLAAFAEFGTLPVPKGKHHSRYTVTLTNQRVTNDDGVWTWCATATRNPVAILTTPGN